MEKIWAPWRSKYIYLRKRKGCIFCSARSEKYPKSRYILTRSRHAFSMLNLYPYNNGHVMVAPFRHVGSPEFLSDKETRDIYSLINHTKILLDGKIHPDGYNIGFNIGSVAGAGFAGHIHAHIVPRWKGDTNFMPILSDCKVVSESLDAMYELLKDKKI